MFQVVNMFLELNMELEHNMQLEVNMQLALNMEQLVEVMSDKLLLILPPQQMAMQFQANNNMQVRLLLIQHNLFMVKLSLIHQDPLHLLMVLELNMVLEKLSPILKEDTQLEDTQLEDMLQVDQEFEELPHTLQEDQEFTLNNTNDSLILFYSIIFSKLVIDL